MSWIFHITCNNWLSVWFCNTSHSLFQFLEMRDLWVCSPWLSEKCLCRLLGGLFTTYVGPSSIKACVVSLRFVSTIHGLLFISFMFLWKDRLYLLMSFNAHIIFTQTCVLYLSSPVSLDYSMKVWWLQQVCYVKGIQLMV